MVANFTLADSDAIGLKIPADTANNSAPLCGVETCYTQKEWNELTSLLTHL
jgi:hypothetical protein